jgi:hypothetical protein
MSDHGYQVGASGVFPLELSGDGEKPGLREAFAWGPQALLLLCVFGWLVLGFAGDLIPPGFTIPLAVSLAGVAALAVIRILRRRASRVVLIPVGDEVGVYREGRLAYRFPASALRKEGWDWFYTLKMAVLIGMLVLISGGLLAVGVRDLWRGVARDAQDLWAFAYLFGCACFALVAVLRSQLLLVWYWMPEGPEGDVRRVGFSRREARRLLAAS